MTRYSRVSSEDILEQENQRRTEKLSDKVNLLKSLAFDIDSDVKEHNSFLGTVDGDFDSSTGFLSGSMNRINSVISNNKNNKKLMCYIILILVGLFIMFYYIIARFTGNSKM